MAEIGVIPASADAYVELASQGGARRFSKHILSVGETFIHPATGKPLTVDESWWADLKRNWDDKVVPICQFPAADERNHHTENPLMNLGRVVDLRREGRKILADIEVPDPAVADKIGKTILGASAMIHMDYPDSRTGRRRGKAIIHVAATNRPHLTSLDDYRELVAATGEGWEAFGDGSSMPPRVLMLCASEIDPAPVMLAEAEPEPDYGDHDYGGPDDMHDDFLRNESARLGLLAAQVSSGRATRLSYDHVTVQREHEERQQAAGLTAEEITEEDLFDAGMRLSGLIGQPFADVMAAARELAFARDEQAAREPRSVAAGLLELTARLGRSVEDLRPDGLLELSSAAEVGRLAGDDSMLALAGSSEDTGAVALASGSGQDSADAVIARHPELAHLFKAGRTSDRKHPARSGRPVTTRTRAHSSDLDEDPSAEDPDSAVARYLAMRQSEFGSEAPHAGGQGSTRYGAKSPC